MTAEEHIIAWIESSQPHYRKLLHISVPGNFLSDLGRAHLRMVGARLMAQRERKERITKKKFYDLGGFANRDLFRKQSRGGAWRYYRTLDNREISA